MSNTEMIARIKTIVRLLDETQAVLRGIVSDLITSDARDSVDVPLARQSDDEVLNA